MLEWAKRLHIRNDLRVDIFLTTAIVVGVFTATRLFFMMIFSAQTRQDQLAGLGNRLPVFSFVEALGMIIVLSFILYSLVTRHTKALAEKADRIAAGDIGIDFAEEHEDSIGALARNLNEMVRRIRDRIEYAESLKLSITDPFFIVDADMRLTYINQAAARLVGAQGEEARSTVECGDIFRTSAWEGEHILGKTVTTGESTDAHRVILKGDNGKEIHFAITSVAFRDSTGTILGAFLLMRDITRKIETEAMLQTELCKKEEERERLRERIEKLFKLFELIANGDLTVRAEVNSEEDIMDQLFLSANYSLEQVEKLIGETRKRALWVIRGVRHINDENQAFAQRTEQEAAAMEEIRATIEEIFSSIHQNSVNTQRADDLSKEAVTVAKSGEATVGKTVQAMLDMAQSSRKIVEMMDLINEITFQTNLLSVNAAVEAARAGEHGRGFAVIANEVRLLANRSSEASKDIRNLVDDISERVNCCTGWIGELEKGFERIIQSTMQASEVLTEVSLASRETQTGVMQIVQAIKEVSDALEQNASLVDELATTVEHFSENAGILQSVTEKFRINIPLDEAADDSQFSAIFTKSKETPLSVRKHIADRSSHRQSFPLNADEEYSDFAKQKKDLEDF